MIKNLQFPLLGVRRRGNYSKETDSRGLFPAAWGANVRSEDALQRRLRGGSRPGLTKVVADDFGSTISDMVSIDVSDASGNARPILFVLVDSAIKTLDGATVSSPVAYLTNESGDTLTDASTNKITVSSGTAPSSGFLVCGQQHVFAINTSGVVKMEPKTGKTDSLVASSGSIPLSCTFGAVYRDRLFLSGQDNAIYASRMGDFTNWNFGDHFEDSRRAMAIQLSHSSEVGEPPTALASCMDQYLIAASRRSLWLIQGDPAAGGSLRQISDEVGIISSRAWVKFSNMLMFLAEDGIYKVNVDGSGLGLMTDSIPDELRHVDTSTKTVNLDWDEDRKAVHVYLRTSGGSDTHWVYEVDSQSFWPVRLQDSHSPLVTCRHAGDLLLAGSDGFIRKTSGNDDDGSNIESHVAIGPMRAAGPNEFGRILNLHASMANGGGTVNWRVVTGNTAEEAAENAKLAIEAFQSGSSYSSYVASEGTWSSGRAVMSYPRVRAVWACLWLQSTAKWAFETVSMESTASGRWRGA
tara:strand:+ start:5780 stop:7348 length:1569 start_codon:yes stop_codon:yes gene_type:complete